MKKAIVFFDFCFLAMIIAVTFSCNKGNSASSSPLYTTPAYIAPTQPGILNISQKSLVLHVTNVATINARIYNSDGTIQVSQPGFIWTSDNSTVASVSGGVITANSIGNALITVTDGSHGLEYVNVSVVAIATTIQTNKYFINFTPPVLSLQTGTSGLFNYTVTTADGKSVAITPAFSSSALSGISISGKAVHAGNTTGLFNVIAVNGIDTLIGTLQILVSNASSPVADTTWKISKLISFPINFSNINLVSLPVRIEVTEIIHRKTMKDSIIKFQTSPDQIIINYPSVISLNSSGMMTSVAPGITDGKLKYKNTEINFYSCVHFKIDGSSWGNGNLNICYPDLGEWIGYFNPLYAMPDPYPPVTCFLTGCNNDKPQISSGGWNCGAAFIPHVDGFYLGDGNIQFWAWVDPIGVKPVNSCVFSWYFNFNVCNKVINEATYIDYNHIKVTTNFGDQTLTRGAGNCSGSVVIPTSDSTFATWSFNGALNQETGAVNGVCIIIPTELDILFVSLTHDTIQFSNPITNSVVAIGAYPINNTQCYVDYKTSNGKYYYSNSGSLNITEVNSNYIAGTFSYNGREMQPLTGICNVTSGSFKVHRQ